MLTLTDIKNITFRKASIGGYRSDEVDDFIDSVIASYEVLLRETEQQKEKLESAMEKIETYRSREENISAALMNAQHQADLVVREAEHRSEAMLQDAEQKAEHILAQAKNKIEEEDMSLQSLKKEIASFKSKLMSLYKEHLMLIDALPGEEKDSDQSPVQEDRTPQPEKEISPQEESVESITKGQSFKNQEEESPVISSTEETVLGGQDMSAKVETDSVQENAAPSAFFEAADFVASPNVPADAPQHVLSDRDASQQEEEIHGFTVDLTAFESITDETFHEPVESPRFGALKFGDDYDINKDDEMKTPFAKFKRRK